MRQGQQNRRGRGRNRKGQSPLTRSFESTGPDVKIRGTPSHIAEKYMSLARDATSSGDPVLAENYLQHAEHYNRIIMAFRDQQLSQGGGDMNGVPRNQSFNDPDGDDFSDEDGDEGDLQPQFRSHEPQPRHEGQRFEGQRGGHEHNRFRDRGGRNDHRNNNRNHDRGDRRDREDRGERHDAQPRPRPEPVEASAPQPAIEAPFQQPRRERFSQQPHEQPEFLRRPVRRPRREANGAAAQEANGAAPAADEGERE